MNIYFLLIFIHVFILNILGQYSSSKRLLDSNLEWSTWVLDISSTRVTRVTWPSPRVE